MLAKHVYADKPAIGGRIILFSILTWFVIDSSGSVVAGAPFNAVLNTSFLLMFTLPVIWPEKFATATTSPAR